VIERVVQETDVLMTEARIVEGPMPNRGLDSPATLQAATGGSIKLHRGKAVGSDRLAFVTFGDTEWPEVGGECVVQWWWIGGIQQMLLDAPGWHRAPHIGHWFCPLTYKNLEDGDPAYTDGRGNWISELGWERFVRDDQLRLRSWNW
jgi:hypothetical protein